MVTRGVRVRLKGKKRCAFVRQVRHTCLGVEVSLTRNLGGYTWHLAADLEVV